MPIGAVLDFAGSSAPAGWLLCFGQAINRTTFASLFAVIGTTYGVGDGVTTFNLPDYRGRVTAGKDNMGGVPAGLIGTVVTDSGVITGTTLGSAGGSSTHAQTNGELSAHTHSLSVTQVGTTTTGNQSANHTHTQQGSFASGGQSQQHTHSPDNGQPFVTGGLSGVFGPGGLGASTANTTGASLDHTHNTTISGATTIQSADHTHSFSGLTASGTSGGQGSSAAMAWLQPTIITNKIIFAGP
jgi:microcystin-dependent protein